MKLLAFYGSPRRGGNTDTLLEAMLAGVEEAGGAVERIRLCDLEIKPCIGCGVCEKTGVCSITDDDMVVLYNKISAGNRIIVASPIYFYGITAQAKAFVDRCQTLWSRKHLAKKEGRWRPDPNRRGFFLSCAATEGKKLFDGAVMTMRYAFDAMDLRYAGDILVRGVEKRSDLAKRQDALDEARAAGRQFVAD